MLIENTVKYYTCAVRRLHDSRDVSGRHRCNI